MLEICIINLLFKYFIEFVLFINRILKNIKNVFLLQKKKCYNKDIYNILLFLH